VEDAASARQGAASRASTAHRFLQQGARVRPKKDLRLTRPAAGGPAKAARTAGPARRSSRRSACRSVAGVEDDGLRLNARPRRRRQARRQAGRTRVSNSLGSSCGWSRHSSGRPRECISTTPGFKAAQTAAISGSQASAHVVHDLSARGEAARAVCGFVCATETMAWGRARRIPSNTGSSRACSSSALTAGVPTTVLVVGVDRRGCFRVNHTAAARAGPSALRAQVDEVRSFVEQG